MKNGVKLAITGLLLCVFFGVSCASRSPQTTSDILQTRIDELKLAVESEIDEPARREAINEVLDELRQETRERGEAIRQGELALVEANARHGTSEEEMEQLMDTLSRERFRVLSSLQESHFKLQGMVSREEWESIAKN